jgi:putative hydrolase of the HAD superfamily
MKIKAVCFDLGDTLIYSGHSLNWSNHYRDALEEGFYSINKIPTDIDYSVCIKILTKYNTRINPREVEISSEQIFNEIMETLKISLSEKKYFEDEFFRYFHQSNKLYNDTEKTLKEIRKCKLKTGILTDVPYGRAKGFLAEEIKPIRENIDVILSSVDIGFRKPNIIGYIELAKKLEVKTSEMVYVGNEEKDIRGANNAGIISVLINRTTDTLNYGEMYQYKNLNEMWNKIKDM